MPPAATISKKRKVNGGEVKYYAVRAGKQPGVYLEWADCQANTTGFRGASYKSFLTRKDAEDFVAGKNPPGPSDAKKVGEKFYGLAVGLKPGVYTDWTECQKQCTGVKGPKYRKFTTRKEAEEWVRDYGKIITKPKSTKAASGGSKRGRAHDIDDSDGSIVEESPVTKKVKAGSKSSSSAAASSASRGRVKVYTDGSSLGNGKVGASAGVGVFFGPNDPRNVSEPLQGLQQTNQRAELMAIVRALELAPMDRDVEIITDSQYSINCVTVWYRSWMAKNWTTSTGGNVVNKDMVVIIRGLIDRRQAGGVETRFTWIKGHADDPGNVAADRLAVAGAQRRG